MSGHNKWSKIKRQKQATDIQKSAIYGRFSREISIAARSGIDPAYNFKLRNLIDRSKTLGVPNDIINKALKKAENNDKNDNFEEITYEGYGVQGIAVLIEVLTDNRNRSAAELRNIFNKNGGNLGEAGCVAWMFERKAIIYIPFKTEEEKNKIEEKLFEIENLEDLDSESDEENILAFTKIENLETCLSEIKKYYECSSEIAYIAKTKIEIENEENAEKLNNLIEMLENFADVRNVFHNGI